MRTSVRVGMVLGLSAWATLLAPGCAPSEPPVSGVDGARQAVAWNGLEYRAETRVLESMPVQLRTTVTVNNPTGSPVEFELPDGCSVLLRAYRETGATVPAWDQLHVRMCTLAIQEVRLGAGETRTFEGSSDAREILGDSLPDGNYRLTAVMRPNRSVVEVPAGTVQLAVPR